LAHLVRRNASERTVTLYGVCLAKLKAWAAATLGRDLRGLRSRDLFEYQVWLSRALSRRGRRYSVGHQAAHISVIRSFYRYLHEEAIVTPDPAKSLQLPRQPKRLHRDILAREELKRLLAQPDDSVLGLRDRVLLRIMALSGLRVSELVALDLDDVDLDEREILVRSGKGGRDRLVFFDVGTRRHLYRYLRRSRPRLAAHDAPALLLSVSGRRLGTVTPGRRLARHARAAGIARRITPHSLRRTFCTLMHRYGANIKVVGELAGHRSLATTARYTRVDIEDLARVYRAAHPRSRDAAGDP
jgi:integrase/recombinase XerD